MKVFNVRIDWTTIFSKLIDFLLSLYSNVDNEKIF